MPTPGPQHLTKHTSSVCSSRHRRASDVERHPLEERMSEANKAVIRRLVAEILSRPPSEIPAELASLLAAQRLAVVG
jgi:hypothetical protein